MSNENEERTNPLIKDMGYAYVGKKLIDKSEGAARGKYVGYHGSTPENMEKMRQEGIKTMGEMQALNKSQTGEMLKGNSTDVFEKSKNLAFIGKKSTGREFIAQAKTGPLPSDPLKKVEHVQTQMRDHWRDMLFGKPLRVEISASEIGKRLVDNPEAVKLESMGAPGKIFSFLSGLSKSKGVVGGVKPSEIVGNPLFKRISLAGMRAKPLRAIAGIGGLLAGTGLIGMGIKNEMDRFRKTSSDIMNDMSNKQESIDSIKYGLCKAMSEHGISPSQFDTLIEKSGFDLSSLNPAHAIGPAMTIALGGGALAGIGTAALRSKIEHMGDGTEDSDMRRSRMKIEMYKKMIADLKSDQSALPA